MGATVAVGDAEDRAAAVVDQAVQVAVAAVPAVDAGQVAVVATGEAAGRGGPRARAPVVADAVLLAAAAVVVVDRAVPAAVAAVVDPAGRAGLVLATEVECADVVPQACQASQAAPWPAPRA